MSVLGHHIVLYNTAPTSHCMSSPGSSQKPHKRAVGGSEDPRSSQAGEVVLPPRAVCSAHVSWPLSLGAGTFLSMATPSSRAALLLSLCVDPAVGRGFGSSTEKIPWGRHLGQPKLQSTKVLHSNLFPSCLRLAEPGDLGPCMLFSHSLCTHIKCCGAC